MSLDYYLYCRIKKGDQWVVPNSEIIKQFGLGQRGEFLYLHLDDLCVTLFSGPNQLIKTNRNYTFSIEDSPCFEWSVLYDGLCVKEWPNTPLIIGAKVEAKYAGVFTDGNQAIPRASLLNSGMPERSIDDLTNGTASQILKSPVDRLAGRGRYELETASADYLLPVSWATSVFDLFGAQRYQKFLKLKDLSKSPGDLMVICERS